MTHGTLPPRIFYNELPHGLQTFVDFVDEKGVTLGAVAQGLDLGEPSYIVKVTLILQKVVDIVRELDFLHSGI